MLTRLLAACALLLTSLAPLAAHGPTPQRAQETIAIASPPEKVWALVADFDGIGGWHPAVKAVSGTATERVLTLEKGEITEGLDEADPAARRLAYRLSKENIEALPVSFYTGTIEVAPAGSGSAVTWEARFYRADTTNEPPEEYNDDAAIAAMTGFLQDGLKGLKAKAEAK